MHVYHTCAWYMQLSEEGMESPGTGVMEIVSHQMDTGN